MRFAYTVATRANANPGFRKRCERCLQTKTLGEARKHNAGIKLRATPSRACLGRGPRAATAACA